ncbi:hypothetical protein MNBD_GAMMA11-1043 [hydrothermal vent metagenome]|uniref:Uncharacterized protein n=1 Tax=hydrothermal vent metagenome TaxID=652676 RepID=A0A3B0X9Q0_9ZZZZ
MSKHTHRFLLHSVAFIFLLLSSSLYAGEPPPTSKLTKADYLELCNIYKKITKKPVSMDTKEEELIDTIDSKLPDLLNELYKHAVWTDPKDRYDYIKEYAKQINKVTWECDAAKQYYINDFKKDK